MKNTLFITKSKTILGIILSFISPFLLAQSEPIPVITRPSAEAMALEKYGEIPTDLYTGRVNIDIPLLNISEYDTNIPIKINYFDRNKSNGRRRTNRIGMDTSFRRNDIAFSLRDA